MKLSKDLKNVIFVKGEQLNEFVKKLYSQHKVISVKVPNKFSKIDTSFIKSNWKFTSVDIDDIIIYGRKSSEAFFAFSNEEIQTDIFYLLEEYKLKGEYKYLLDCGEKGFIETEEFDFSKGDIVIDECKNLDEIFLNDGYFESSTFKLNNYNIGLCFQ